jgi:general secretion pathway protein D
MILEPKRGCILSIFRVWIVLLVLVSSIYARERISINFNNMQIDNFIKLVAKITDQNILINYKIKGRVDFVSTKPIYEDEIMNVLISVLNTKGYTIVKNGEMLEVVKSLDVVKKSLDVIDDSDSASGHFMLTQSITLKNQNIDIVASKVRYMLSKFGKIVTMRETNSLVITDYPKKIESIKKIITKLEKKSKSIVQIVEIKDAEINEVYSDAKDISKGIFNTKVETEKVKVLLNKDINAIILIGKRDNVYRLKNIIQHLDKKKDIDKSLKIYYLKNSIAKNVLKSIENIIKNQKFADDSLRPQLSLNEETNSIMVFGTPSYTRSIKKMIQDLDKEKYQVYVQARIIEINRVKSKKIGLQYGFAGGKLTPSGLYAMSANFSSSSNGIDLAANAAKVVSNTLTSTITGGAKDALALGASLDFLQAKGAAKTVSTPSLLCLDNIKSSIEVGKVVSFQTGTTTTNGGNTNTSLSRENVGLILTIQPRVSSYQKVSLDIDIQLESLTGDSTNNQPNTVKQNVNTQAILRDGESIIVGGLVKTFSTDKENKVPILGDIPILGSAFRHNAKHVEQDNLIVVLTPYIIDSSNKLSNLQKRLGEISMVQKEFNKKVFKKIEERKIDKD